MGQPAINTMPESFSPPPISDVWERRYRVEGRMWGMDPSPTAEKLMAEIRKGPEEGKSTSIIDVGCGYGRDSIALAYAGHIVTGIDKSPRGIDLANETWHDLKTDMHRRAPLGNVSFWIGTIGTVLASNVGTFGAISSHRALHLFNDDEVEEFVREAAKRLRPSGILCVSARSPKDFKPDQMVYVTNTPTTKTAVYKDPAREGQVINFWNRARFESTFKTYFNIEAIEKTEEPESTRNPVATILNQMFARRKSNELVPINGKH